MGLGSSQKVAKIYTEYTYNQEFKQQQLEIKKKKLVRRLSGIGLCAFILFAIIGFTLYRHTQQLEEMLAQKVKLEQELFELQKTEKSLHAEVNKLENNDYVAKIARSEYFLSNDGEVIFKVAE